MSFLAVDIGNTRLKWALYDQPAPQAVMLAHGAEFLENIDKLADGPWKALPTPQRMRGRPLQPLVDGTASDWGDDVCVSLAVVGDDAASTDAIGERLSSWAETSPTEAEVDQGADGVRLTSCDPGADAEAGGAVTSDLLAVPATRTAVTTSLLASGAPADRATCGGRAVVSVLTVAEMTDPDLGASAGVRARTRDAIAGCA